MNIEERKNLDDEYSKRHINLDPDGYFIIYLDRESDLICAKHYTNIINEKGLAVDPETGLVIPCDGKNQRVSNTLFTGKTAKEVCIKIFEESNPILLSMFDHAAYLGRELMRAEFALFSGEDYIQD